MKRKPSVGAKLEALKEGRELQVDLSILSEPGTYPDTDESAVLALARAFQREENPNYWAVSWGNQEKASAFFNGNGLVRTLERIAELESELDESEQDE